MSRFLTVLDSERNVCVGLYLSERNLETSEKREEATFNEIIYLHSRDIDRQIS